MKQIILFILVLATSIFGQATIKKSNLRTVPPPPPAPATVVGPADVDHRWSDLISPYEFTAQVGVFNPGYGIGLLGGRRLLNSVIPRIDDSLSGELGVQNVGSIGAWIFSGFGRWDFHFQHLTVSARAGIALYSYGSFFARLGPSVFYPLTQKLYFRGDLLWGGPSQLTLGVTYFL